MKTTMKTLHEVLKTREDRGQAMVEFVLILIIVMGVTAGMCAIIRLLTYQFWAQQESRFLAFEQVWSAAEFYNDNGNNPLSFLEPGTDIGRPAMVTNREHSRTADDDGSMTDLLSWLGIGDNGAAQSLDLPIETTPDSTSVLLAKTSPREMLSWVSTAFARQDSDEGLGLKVDSLDSEDLNPRTNRPVATSFQEKIGRGFENIFDKHGFGEQFCAAGLERLRNIQSVSSLPLRKIFSSKSCATNMNRDFGLYLGENLDFREFFEDFSDRLEWGDAPPDALQGTIRHSVGNHFYSFFDTLVGTSRSLAFPILAAEAADAATTLVDSSVTRLITDFRYVGSPIAVGAVVAAAIPMNLNILSNDPLEVLQRERDFLVDVLHVDAEDFVPGGAAYFLSPTYLPVPPLFGATAPAFQEAAMKNLLFEESGLVDPFIDNTVKKVRVSYKASGGLFPAAVRRFSGIENVELTSNYSIVTEPWHITRRISSNGDYRQKGTQLDDIDDNTEEAVLRRRVSGLWLLPSNVGAFLQPISALPGLGFLGPIFDAFEPLSSVLGFIKSYVLVDNPIFQIFDALSSLPGIGGLFPTVPKFPAVRPDAYVGSEEMTSNDVNQPDKLMGENREFEDYLQEQRDFNPAPEPSFN